MLNYYVYIIQSGDRPKSPIKIGVSSNIDKRVSDLQTGNPHPLKVMAAIECRDKKDAYKLENLIHRKLTRYRMKGEWFRGCYINFKEIFGSYSNSTGIHHELMPVKKLNCKDSKIKNLEAEIKILKSENRRLVMDMEEYLDSQISEFE